MYNCLLAKVSKTFVLPIIYREKSFLFKVFKTCLLNLHYLCVMMYGIQLINLSIGYSHHCVASNLNAQLNNSSLTCLLGSNGVGKSTLLRTLAGFQPILSGDVRIGNASLCNISQKELSQKQSVVLTDKIDARNLTVNEVVAMGRMPYTNFWGRLSDSDHKIVQQCIEMMGLTSLSQQKIHTLSDGERQKTMLAKAMAQQTSIILLDEPTAFLDFKSKAETMQLLSHMAHQYHKSILLSTHDIHLAVLFADQLWLLSRHQPCLQMGSPQQLKGNGVLYSFLDCPPNYFELYDYL